MNLFTAFRLGDDLARIGYDCVTWLLTGGSAHDYDKPVDGGDRRSRVTRCTRCNERYPDDCHCGADRLNEAEESREVWDGGDCFDCCIGHPETFGDVSSIPEPALTEDELVAVRGLLQERYDDDAWDDRDGGRCLFCGATREYVAATDGCVGPLCPHKTSPASRGAGDRPAAEVGHPPVPPAAGPQTSQLLTKAGNMIADITLGLNAYDEVYRLDFVAQLRERAAAFKAHEDEGRR